MSILSSLVFFPFLVSFVATAILTFVSIGLLKRFGLLDNPKTHKHPAIIHSKPIPRGGGIPIFLGALIAAIFFLPITKITLSIFLASLLALIIGVIDDKLNANGKDLSPYLRFFINILTAIIIVSSGISIRFITDPFGGILHLPILFSDLVSVVWLVWVMNMLNWSKGIDG